MSDLIKSDQYKKSSDLTKFFNKVENTQEYLKVIQKIHKNESKKQPTLTKSASVEKSTLVVSFNFCPMFCAK